MRKTHQNIANVPESRHIALQNMEQEGDIPRGKTKSLDKISYF